MTGRERLDVFVLRGPGDARWAAVPACQEHRLGRRDAAIVSIMDPMEMNDGAFVTALNGMLSVVRNVIERDSSRRVFMTVFEHHLGQPWARYWSGAVVWQQPLTQGLVNCQWPLGCIQKIVEDPSVEQELVDHLLSHQAISRGSYLPLCEVARVNGLRPLPLVPVPAVEFGTLSNATVDVFASEEWLHYAARYGIQV